MDSKIRLAKILSMRGIASRREAEDLIARGAVYVDGEQIIEQGLKFSPEVEIEVTAKRSVATVLLHKPCGYVSTQPEKGYPEALELIREDTKTGPGKWSPMIRKKLACCGRLDIESKGLLIFTQDGVLAKKLIGEHSRVEKEYLVHFQGQCTPKIRERLQHGLRLDGKALKPARVKSIDTQLLHLVLHEGKKRQIRRMFELVGLHVTSLKRVRVGPFRLGDLPSGKWRYATSQELTSPLLQ